MNDSKTIDDGTTETTWRDKTLKAAGMGYIVGDFGMMGAGHLRGKPLTVGGAAAWLVGGAGMAVYGNPDIDKQLSIQASKLEDYLKKKGVKITVDARAQSDLLKDKSVWAHVEQFLYEHPSELLNGMYALGSGMLLHESFIKDMAIEGKKIIPRGLSSAAFKNVSSTFWIGALVGAGALIGLFVKEDADARKHQDSTSGIIDRAMAYVKEQPLRASAALYTANNGILALKTYQDFSDRNIAYAGKSLKPHHASGLQLAAYLFSNFMLFLSPRNQITKNGFAAYDMAKLENAAASIIAAQPAQVQQTVLADISEFMATQKGVNMKAPEIAQHLAARVTELTSDRMHLAAAKVGHAAKEQARRAHADAAPTLA